MTRSEKVAKVGDIEPKDLVHAIGDRIVEEFEKAGLSGYQHCVMCSEEEAVGKVSAILLPIENFDGETQSIDPGTGLILIHHVLLMMNNAFDKMGLEDEKLMLDEYMKAAGRPTMTIGRLVSTMLPKMAKDGGTPIVWEIKGGDEGDVLIIADGRHFSEIDGLPDAYLMGSLLEFFIEMAAKGAGQVPAGSEVESIIDELESMANGEEGKKDDQS